MKDYYKKLNLQRSLVKKLISKIKKALKGTSNLCTLWREISNLLHKLILLLNLIRVLNWKHRLKTSV
jgi:hypothetical protein